VTDDLNESMRGLNAMQLFTKAVLQVEFRKCPLPSHPNITDVQGECACPFCSQEFLNIVFNQIKFTNLK